MKIPLFGREKAARAQLVAKATREVETGRRLAMYDRQTGLHAYWYFLQRFEEESKRADRNGSDLSIMLVEVVKDSDFRVQDQVAVWLKQELRGHDLATHLGDGRFLAALTETSLEAAEALVARFQQSFAEGLIIGLSCSPQDGSQLDELQAVARASALGSEALVLKLG
jgi:GGDEF domain-containing protein